MATETEIDIVADAIAKANEETSGSTFSALLRDFARVAIETTDRHREAMSQPSTPALRAFEHFKQTDAFQHYLRDAAIPSRTEMALWKAIAACFQIAAVSDMLAALHIAHEWFENGDHIPQIVDGRPPHIEGPQITKVRTTIRAAIAKAASRSPQQGEQP